MKGYTQAEGHSSKMILSQLLINLAAIRIIWLHLRSVKSEGDDRAQEWLFFLKWLFFCNYPW